MTNLTPEVAELLNANGVVMVNNFTKMVSWVLHGENSPHPMPAALANFVAGYHALQATVKEQEGIIAHQQATINEIGEVLARLQVGLAGVEQRLNGVDDTLSDLEKKAAAPKRTRKKAEAESEAPTPAPQPTAAPQVATPTTQTTSLPAMESLDSAPQATAEQPVQQPTMTADPVALTAAAVEAGEVSTAGIQEISNLIDGVLGTLGGQ